ncbi:MAG: malonate decarboxylase holo-ACP synthase [Candidatus Obscuribacterales bacterium]|nr:malonate decarboxylase holo-ACP synthase [Candidatus Obscuribacterales bacterium]
MKVHDLLEIESPLSAIELSDAPSWVGESLSAIPFVVVRRARLAANGIAVGVRGNRRSERWGGVLNPAFVKRVIAPFELRAGRTCLSSERRRIPALNSLIELEAHWDSCGLLWGPGGSVGFELASGAPAASESSDLDLVVFGPEPFDSDFASKLLLSIRRISPSIDVVVESPTCGFSLDEYANNPGRDVLLRCSDIARFGNPWCVEVVSPEKQGAPVFAESGP